MVMKPPRVAQTILKLVTAKVGMFTVKKMLIVGRSDRGDVDNSCKTAEMLVS